MKWCAMRLRDTVNMREGAEAEGPDDQAVEQLVAAMNTWEVQYRISQWSRNARRMVHSDQISRTAVW
jgi:hypothetical protein